MFVEINYVRLHVTKDENREWENGRVGDGENQMGRPFLHSPTHPFVFRGGNIMCRFLVYKGSPLLMADLITRPTNSLIKQSYHAREQPEPLNGDGFGVGWYAPEVDSTPCVLTRITPAWSSRNLLNLAEKVVSPCIFAHVRAASPGMAVTELNCHPFQYGRFMWMHNGGVAQFPKIKRRLRQSLSDELYNFIQGTTDSEHAFALFLNQLPDPLGDYTPEQLAQAVATTIRQLNIWTREADIIEPSYYNFAVTDGHNVIVTRYVNDPGQEPRTLHVSYGAKFECHDGNCRMVRAEEHEQAVIIASEPLTDLNEDWVRVPKNHLVMVTPDLKVGFLPIE